MFLTPSLAQDRDGGAGCAPLRDVDFPAEQEGPTGQNGVGLTLRF